MQFYGIIAFLAILVLTSYLMFSNQTVYKVIDTRLGSIRGVEKTTLLQGKKYFAFRGVPYAKPPIGKLRFKVPEPVDPWAPNVIDATKFGPACIQDAIQYSLYGLSEDCLFLNIFVPAEPDDTEETGMAVLLHIFGGGFMIGHGGAFSNGPDFLIEKGIIVASLNHRLGILGFLSLDIIDISGNQGLKDQQMALQWLFENIDSFGGDRNRITLSGISSGGISVDFHAFNPESAKYMHSVIPMSGVMTLPMFKFERYIEELCDLAASQSYAVSSCDDLIEFLQSMDAQQLNDLTGIPDEGVYVKLGSTIERKDAIRPFITEMPERILNDSSRYTVPALQTYANREYMFIGNVKKVTDSGTVQALIDTFVSDPPFAQNGLFIKDSESEAYKTILIKICDFYTANATSDEEWTNSYLDLFSDTEFIYYILTEAIARSRYTNIDSYLIEYEIDSALNILKLIENVKLPGTVHGDEQCYIFRCHAVDFICKFILLNTESETSKICLQTIEYLSSIISNYVRYGTPIRNGYPTPVFDPLTANSLKYLRVTNDGLFFDGYVDEDKLHFLDGVADEIFQIVDVETSEQHLTQQCSSDLP